MPPATFRTDFLAAGGNRNPQSADWDIESNLIAFAAGSSIAVWSPKDRENAEIRAILGGRNGHSAQVNAVRFLPSRVFDQTAILSGAADKTLKLWLQDGHYSFHCRLTLAGHNAPVNVVTIAGNLVVSGSVDGVLKVWRLSASLPAEESAVCVSSTTLTPKFIPLCIAASSISDQSYLCAVAGTTNKVHIYLLTLEGLHFKASLPGHEGWVRSLDIRKDGESLVLASASQDKYIRIWRVQQDSQKPDDDFLQKTLENKAHRLRIDDRDWIVTFEALLLGHEDWVFSARWKPSGAPELLSASADNTLAFWSPDPETGVWVNTTRLGYLAVVKGGTSATGSTGGHWVGLWSGDGKSVVSLGRSGGWRRWDTDGSIWHQKPAVTGHWKEVNGICWSRDGGYLLTTSADQTTRLWAKEPGGTWHEFARPQIHGYDLNCIDIVTPTQFVSGADEKLLRVFDQPKSTAHLLDKLSGIATVSSELPRAANIPALGLSNKAVDANVEDGESFQETSRLPLEDDLAQHTLWPEREKLYGHGFEISSVASSHDGTLIATACKASSIDHALIRIYSTSDWKEVKPALKAHSLTITRLRFSPDDSHLISVGRDREINLFKRERSDSSKFELLEKKEKAHTRMILDIAWASNTIFATAGRDKRVGIWRVDHGSITSCQSISTAQPATAIDATLYNDEPYFAVGFDDGSVAIYSLDAQMALKPTIPLSEE